MKWLVRLALAACLGCSALHALSDADQAAIEGVITDYTRCWNEKGCVGFANYFSADADFVNIYGMYIQGAETIEERHVQILQTFLKGSQLEIVDTRLREVQPGIVAAVIQWRLSGGQEATIRQGVFTHLFVQTGDRWEISLCQNTLRTASPKTTN